MDASQDIKELFLYLMKSQWSSIPDISLVDQYPILTKDEFRKIDQEKGLYTSKTSGSTGEQVSVEKYYEDIVWNGALGLRSIVWSGMDPSLNICQIRTAPGTGIEFSWGLPKWFFNREQGKIFYTQNTDIASLQRWIDRKKPHYIQCLPSVARQLDTTRIPNFRSFNCTGEVGGDDYSSEEFGLIAKLCPSGSKKYHVSENIIIEVDNSGAAYISNIAHPYLKRYAIGDVITFGKCDCGRTLQTISSIEGRVRNLITYPDGRRMWPMFGSKYLYSDFNIKRFQMVQIDINTLELSVVSDAIDEDALSKFICKNLNYDFNVLIKKVSGFPVGKFEEFKSLV